VDRFSGGRRGARENGCDLATVGGGGVRACLPPDGAPVAVPRPDTAAAAPCRAKTRF